MKSDNKFIVQLNVVEMNAKHFQDTEKSIQVRLATPQSLETLCKWKQEQLIENSLLETSHKATRWHESTVLDLISYSAMCNRGVYPPAESSVFSQVRCIFFQRKKKKMTLFRTQRGYSALPMHTLRKCRIKFGIVKIISVFTGAS
ncbi:hypothetical protein H1C71_002900 [Ictidomys tridecemlineatus]|nr:hypothetical protein H1C71_002900 [Ictidomys tridecemlineatus]